MSCRSFLVRHGVDHLRALDELAGTLEPQVMFCPFSADE